MFWDPWKADEELYNNAGHISKVSKDIASESTENCRRRQPHCRLTPLSRKPQQISTQIIHSQNLESLSYIFADSVGLSSFKFSWYAPKDACFVQ